MYDFIRLSDTIFDFGCLIIFSNFGAHKKLNQMSAKKGDAVAVHYTGRLEDGSIFDSSVSRSPLSFTLGDGNMIKGFDSAVYGMGIGDIKTVTFPAAEAYGERREDMMIEVPLSEVPQHIEA